MDSQTPRAASSRSPATELEKESAGGTSSVNSPTRAKPAFGRVGILLLGVSIAVLWVTFAQMGKVPIYLTSDSGHSLADADALFGNGVRESRHLPLFPALLAFVRLFVTDLTAVKVAMALVIVALIASFYFFVKGRTGSPLGEVVGAAFFVLAPVYGEAVGWYGAVTLLGLAGSLVAMRLIDNCIIRPDGRRVITAGLVAGIVGLTHPFSFIVLAEIVAVSLLLMGSIAAVAAWRARRWERAGYGQQMRAIAGIALIALATTLPAIAFYSAVQNPLSINLDAGRLSLIPNWAFREDTVLWLVLLVGAVGLIPVAKWLAGSTGLRFGIWASATALVAVGNLVALGGDTSYTTRSLYLLPVVMAATAAVFFASVARLGSMWSGTRKRLVLLGIATVVVGASIMWATHSYMTRLDIAIPFYNTLTTAEWQGIKWLDGRDGTVVVTAKSSNDVNAGTLYAWMIEGASNVHAVGAGEDWLFLMEGPRKESLDVERLLSGSHVVESGSLRLASTAGRSAPIAIFGRIDRSWYQLAELHVLTGPPEDPSGRAISTDLDSQLGRLTILDEASNVTATLTLAPGSAVVGFDTAASSSAPNEGIVIKPAGLVASLLIGGSQATITQQIAGRAVTFEISPSEGLSLTIGRDQQGRGSVVRVEPAESRVVAMQLRVLGLDRSDSPIALYGDTELLTLLDVSYTFSWHKAGTGARFVDDPCYELAFSNEEILIMSVKRPCTRETVSTRAE